MVHLDGEVDKIGVCQIEFSPVLGGNQAKRETGIKYLIPAQLSFDGLVHFFVCLVGEGGGCWFFFSFLFCLPLFCFFFSFLFFFNYPRSDGLNSLISRTLTDL